MSRLRSSFHEVGRAHFWKLCSSKSASLLPLFVVRNLLPLFVVSSTWKEKLRASDAFHTITVRDIPSSTTWHTTGYHLRVRARSAPLLIGKWVFYDKDQFTIKEKKERRKEGNTARVSPSTCGWSTFVLSRYAFLAFRLSFVSFSRINFLHSCACYVV